MTQSSNMREGDKGADATAGWTAARLATVSAPAGLILFALAGWSGREILSTPGAFVPLALGAIGAALILAAIALFALDDGTSGDSARALLPVLDAQSRGDFSVELNASTIADAQLARAATASILNTRTLLSQLQAHARETASRANDLSAQVAIVQSASQRTAESAALSHHAAAALGDSTQLLQDDGAKLRSATSSIAREHRVTLATVTRVKDSAHSAVEESARAARALENLASRLGGASGDLDALRASAEEIRSFVALVRKMARQSKLLALNAAMEAARAGEQGSGFAVVAGEVRRLARTSSEAADRTEALVSGVLEHVSRVYGIAGESGGALAEGRDAHGRTHALVREIDRQLHAVVMPNSDRDDVMSQAAPMADSMTVRLEALQREAAAMAATARDAQLASAAQAARLQDLAAASNTLVRAAQKGDIATASLTLHDASTTTPAGGEGLTTRGAQPPSTSATPHLASA